MSTFAERLWSKVQKTEGCWLWTASLNAYGYGQIRLPDGRVGRAHKVVYEELVGPVPDGLQLDHLCRNRACVNPAHLEPVTQRTNTLRGEGFAARNATKRFCPVGHPYDEKNTYLDTKGRRRCRPCHAARERSAARWRRA